MFWEAVVYKRRPKTKRDGEGGLTLKGRGTVFSDLRQCPEIRLTFILLFFYMNNYYFKKTY